MIIIDYNAVSLAAMFSLREKPTENLLRHMILNSIRMHNVKYRNTHGRLVIACDHGSWRRDMFTQYKASRATSRSESDLDWKFIFEVLSKVQVEISENLPWKVINIPNVEADDIIGVLCQYTQEFGKNEPVMIISSDKDFRQLQRYPNIKQWSPATKKLIVEKNPLDYLFEHICRGDVGDGIPNILSADDAIVNSIRQSPITQKKLDVWFKSRNNLESIFDENTLRNFCRNRLMIDLTYIPEEIKSQIIHAYETCKLKTNILNYLIAKRCNNLLECAEEFNTYEAKNT